MGLLCILVGFSNRGWVLIEVAISDRGGVRDTSGQNQQLLLVRVLRT